MHLNAALSLRLALDLMVATGISRDIAEAKALVATKLREYAAAVPPDGIERRGLTAPRQAGAPFGAAERAALDGMLGALMQIGEHAELLAEGLAATTRPPRLSW